MSTGSVVLSTGPPVKKGGFVRKFLCFFLPRRYHKYVTPEVVVAWTISDWFTWAQAYVFFNWEKVHLWLTVKVYPFLEKSWLIAKGVAADVAGLYSHTQ